MAVTTDLGDMMFSLIFCDATFIAANFDTCEHRRANLGISCPVLLDYLGVSRVQSL